MNAGRSSRRRSTVRIGADGRDAIEKIVPVNGGFTEAKLSPNGKEFAFVFRGEIFVSSIDGKIVKRITNTPWQERSVSFSPDGRSLVYAAEKDNNWNVYTTSLTRKQEPYFFASTVLKEEAVVATPAEEFQPAFSPDGKEIAYLENRQTLKVYNLASKQSRTVLPADLNYSYADGDQYYSVVARLEVAAGPVRSRRSGCLRRRSASSPPTASGELRNLTQSGYDDVTPKWAMDGKMMIWGSTREGALSQGGGAVIGRRLRDVLHEGGLSTGRSCRKKNSRCEGAGRQGQEGGRGKSKGSETPTPTTPPPTPKPTTRKPIAFDWDGLTDRKTRLTFNTSAASDWVLVEGRREAFLPDELREGQRPLGHRDAHARDQALQQARCEQRVDGALARRQIPLRPRRRQGDQGRRRERQVRTDRASTPRWS